MSSNLKFSWALFKTNLKSAAAQRGAFALSMTFMALNNFIVFVFWWVLFGKVPHLRGWHVGDVQLLFGISAAGFGSMQALAGGAMGLSRFIDEGSLEPLLTQPKPTLSYALGCRSQASGFGDFCSGVAFIAMSGYWSWASTPLVVLAVATSAVTFTAACVLFGSLAFWIPRSHVLSRQLLDLTITFSLYPDVLFGGVLRLLLFTLLPAGFIAYVPAALVRSASWTDFALTLLGGALFAWLAGRAFRAGLRRYSSGSRFGVFG
jgi:ABC-2 type transport system permease protein